jgi:hypothetical protein
MQFMSRHQCQYDGEPSYDSGQYGKDYGEEYKPPGLYLNAGPEAAHRFNEGTLTTHRGLGFRGQFFVCQVPPRFLLLHGAISPGDSVLARDVYLSTPTSAVSSIAKVQGMVARAAAVMLIGLGS